jgi:DNA-binding transcriptional regulator YhcF (GntR family)
MEGFIFQTNKKHYFIETHYTNKTKTIAKRFLDYFMNEKFDGCGFIPLHIVNNTFNKIYREMRQATIQLSNDNDWYFIHEKYAGATIPKTDIVIIKEVN